MLDDLRLQKHLVSSYLIEADLVVVQLLLLLLIWIEVPHI